MEKIKEERNAYKINRKREQKEIRTSKNIGCR
jgi:hypothetical protein